jgi:Mor family transcriptional regulator
MPTQTPLKERLKNLRNEILKEAWQKYKGLVSMEELGQMFSLSTASIYRIVKEANKNGDIQ